MTTYPTAKTLVAKPNPSLAHVRAQIAASGNIPSGQRKDICSALSRFAQLMDRPLEDLPADPGYLRECIKEFIPATAGLSSSRWKNIKCLLRRALKETGLASMPGRSTVPMTPPWLDLFKHINQVDIRVGLSRFARYCGSHGINPEHVTDETLLLFYDELHNGGIIDNPRVVHQVTCSIWNKAAALIPAWPAYRLTVPHYRNDYVLPWDIFPTSLKTDVDAYIDHLAGTDILAERDFRPLKPISIATRMKQLGGFLSALVHRGRDPQTICSLRDAVTEEAFRSGLYFFLERSGDGDKKLAASMAYLIKGVAKHWVDVDPAHLKKLKRIAFNLDPDTRGMTDQNRTRLRQFDDPVNVRSLVNLPQHLVKTVSRIQSPRMQALRIQSALLIELLLMIPMRLGNLGRLNLESHFIRSRQNGNITLVIPGSEVKNGVGIEAPLPKMTADIFDLYVKQYRPLLLNEISSALFPGIGQKPKSLLQIREQITACVAKECGLVINPHLFRHIAAKLYLDQNPGGYGVVRLINGHKSVETTTTYYCGTEGPAAMKHFDEHILKLRPPQPAILPPTRGRKAA